jgi:hypothetical protein
MAQVFTTSSTPCSQQTLPGQPTTSPGVLLPFIPRPPTCLPNSCLALPLPLAVPWRGMAWQDRTEPQERTYYKILIHLPFPVAKRAKGSGSPPAPAARVEHQSCGKRTQGKIQTGAPTPTTTIHYTTPRHMAPYIPSYRFGADSLCPPPSLLFCNFCPSAFSLPFTVVTRGPDSRFLFGIKIALNSDHDRCPWVYAPSHYWWHRYQCHMVI